MRILSYALLLGGLAVLLPLPSVFTSEPKAEPGFTAIFNGKDLTGWRQKSDKAPLDGKTEAYMGRHKVEGGSLIYVYKDKLKQNRYIETTKEYAKDAHFKFDFKAGPECNNDILFRGLKFDIVPGKGETKDVKEGEWYTYELIAAGDKVEHKINGKTVRKAQMAKDKSNHFVLRAEFGVIEIKNIRVKE
jgi:Domain of Unknown Function (DUF1080)